MWTGLVLGSALVSRGAIAQNGSSVSLTHVVTVTVPPRVKVQVNNVAPVVQSALRASSVQAATDGLALTISATQSWTLSIGSAAENSTLQWSHDRISGFAKVSGNDATVASGTISQVPIDAAVFFRDATPVASSNRGSSEGSEAVVLTVVAQ
jgi:hypothetical protein